MLTRRELLILTLGFMLTLPAVTTRIYASDEMQYFSWLRSVTFDHDVSFENEYRYFWDRGVSHTPDSYTTFFELKNEAGRTINFAPVGSAMLWAPFYAVGHVAAVVTGAPRDGFSPPYIKAVAYGSATYAFLAVLLSIAIARRIVGHGRDTALLILIGTPLIFYTYVAPVYSHACAAFAVALFLWTWLRIRDTWTVRGVIALGAAGALMAMVREQDVFFVAGPALDFIRWALAHRPTGSASRPRLDGPVGPMGLVTRALVGGVTFLVCYLPQLIAYKSLNGHFGPTYLAWRKMFWTSPHKWDVLINPHHGFFIWTPLALVAIAGLVLLALRGARFRAHDAAWLGTLALVMVATQIYISGAVESWTVAGSFGQRRFVSLTPLLVLGLAALWHGWPDTVTRRARGIVSVLVIVCIWWNLGLMAQFGDSRMDRQQLMLKDNAWQTFVVLPHDAPSLVWRYFTDRASFYRVHPH
jgi:hypothetical protein